MNQPIIKTLWVAALLSVFVQTGLFAQEKPKPHTTLSPALERIAKPGSSNEWVNFRESEHFKPEALFEEQREAFQLGKADEMRLQRTETDQLGFTHYRYQQYYQGIPVWGAEMIVHTDAAGRTYAANGKTAPHLELSTSPAISESNARKKALSLVKAEAGLWKDPAAERRRQQQENDPTATFDPQGELIFVPHQDSYRLAWKYALYLRRPEVSKVVFLDAQDGKLLVSYPLTYNCEPGKVQTPWYGERTVNTSISGSTFFLQDDCQAPSPLISVKHYNFGVGELEIESPDNQWSGTDLEIAGGTTLWCLNQSFNYFDIVHNRFSWDGSGANINALIEEGMANAYWDGGFQELGFGTAEVGASDDFTTLDIVGHELTHAVTQTTAGLVYLDESGALNESFSDIFGEMVEAFTLGNIDWLVGGERGALRSMSSPGDYFQPDTYQGDNWCDFTNWCTSDNGGVHTNSGVQNHWFYLLSIGGEGVNDDNKPFVVNGIGAQKAAAIAYHNLSFYLTSTSTYQDARLGSLQAAIDLFGPCSMEYFETSKAWYAVGVGSNMAGSGLKVCGLVTSGSFYSPDSLQSGGAGCQTMVIPSETGVSFQAAEEITLKDGFTATAIDTNAFRAFIGDDCTVATQRISSLPTGVSEVYTTPIVTRTIPSEDESLKGAQPGPTLLLTPNPVSDMLTVHYSAPSANISQIMVFNGQGQLIMAQELMSPGINGQGAIEIDVSHFPSGLYVFRLSAGALSETKRLLISR